MASNGDDVPDNTTYRLGGSNGYPAAYWNPPVAMGSYPPPVAPGILGTSHDINTPVSAVPVTDASVESDEGSANSNTSLDQGSGALNGGPETASAHNTSGEEADAPVTGSSSQIITPPAAIVSSREIGNQDDEIEVPESSTAGAARERLDPYSRPSGSPSAIGPDERLDPYSRPPGSPSAIGPDERFMEHLDDNTPTVGEGFPPWNSTDGDNGSIEGQQIGKRVRIRRSIASGMQAMREEFEALRANLANLGTTTRPRVQVESGERRRTSSSFFKSIAERKRKSRTETSENTTNGVELSTMKGKKPAVARETGFVALGRPRRVPQGQENERPTTSRGNGENSVAEADPVPLLSGLSPQGTPPNPRAASGAAASTAVHDSGNGRPTGNRPPGRQDYLDDIFGAGNGYSRRTGFFTRIGQRRTRSEGGQNPMPVGRMDGTNDVPERTGVSRSLVTFGKKAGKKVKKIVEGGVATLRGKKGDYVAEEGVLGEEIPMESAPMAGALMPGMQSEAVNGVQDTENTEGETTEGGEGGRKRGFMKSVREWRRSGRRRQVHSFF